MIYMECETAESLTTNQQWWKILHSSIPDGECESDRTVIEGVRDGRCIAASAYDGKDLLGIAHAQMLESFPAVFLNYIAVDAEQRDHHIGGGLLEFVWQEGGGMLRAKGLEPRGYVWEVEIPELAANAEEKVIREKRIEFYTRHGAAILPCRYELPPLKPGNAATPLHLMFRPANGGMPSAAEIRPLIRAIYFEKYAKVSHISEEMLERLLTKCNEAPI